MTRSGFPSSTPSSLRSCRPEDFVIRELHRRDGVAMLELGPLCIALWRGAVTPQSFRWQRDAIEQVAARHPEGFAFLCLIEPGTIPPDATMRRASVDLFLAHATVMKCVAFVVLGEGFRASLHRGVLSAMALINPRMAPTAAFSTVEEALAWTQDRVRIRMPSAARRRIEEERELLATAS